MIVLTCHDLPARRSGTTYVYIAISGPCRIAIENIIIKMIHIVIPVPQVRSGAGAAGTRWGRDRRRDDGSLSHGAHGVGPGPAGPAHGMGMGIGIWPGIGPGIGLINNIEVK